MAKKDDAYAICTAQKKKSGMGHDAWKRCVAKLKKPTTKASINELWDLHHHTDLSPRARALVHAKRTGDEAAIRRHSAVLADEDEYKDDPQKMLKSIHHHTTLEKDDPRYREFDKWGSHEHDRGRKNFTGGATGGAIWRDPKDQALFTRDEFPGEGPRSDDEPEESEEEKKDEDRIMTFNKRLIDLLEKKALKTEKMKNALPDGPKAAPKATKSDNEAEAEMDDEETSIVDDCGTKLVAKYRAKKKKGVEEADAYGLKGGDSDDETEFNYERDTTPEQRNAARKKARAEANAARAKAGLGPLPDDDSKTEAKVKETTSGQPKRPFSGGGSLAHEDPNDRFGVPSDEEVARVRKSRIAAGLCADGSKPPCKEDEPESKTEAKKGKKDDKWIQKAVDPDHEGFCTPMTKATCTPKRKSLAKTFKKMGKKKDKAIKAKDEK